MFIVLVSFWRLTSFFSFSSPGKESSFRYYVSDGVYGSFNCLLYDHAVVEAQVLDVSIWTGTMYNFFGALMILENIVSLVYLRLVFVMSSFRAPFRASPFIPAACGVQPATPLTASWNRPSCQNWISVIGSSLKVSHSCYTSVFASMVFAWVGSSCIVINTYFDFFLSNKRYQKPRIESWQVT